MRAISFLFAASLLAAGGLSGAPPVVAVDIDGMVHPVTVEIVNRAMTQAKAGNAEILLIRLNTPGGLMDAMRRVIELMMASPVPVVTYVTPSGGRAASAGFFILEAGDIAAMSPGTNAGAASPVLLGQQMDPVMRRKVENDAAAEMRSIAAKHGRNAALAEKAVFESKSYTDKEALEGRLIDLIAADEADLLKQLDGREIVRFDGRKQVLRLTGAAVVTYEKTVREKIVTALADPNLALVLLVIGALGLYVEFTSPGLIVPGIAGAILVLLGLSGLSVLPINWAGAALILLAFGLFILEAKFATHGILAAGGAIAMVFGSLLLVKSPVPEMRIHLPTALALTIPFAIITTFLLSLVIRARANKVVTGRSGMIDEVGVAYTPLAPGGKVFVHGEYWDAICTEPVEAGARVKVKDVVGLTLRVEPATKQTTEADTCLFPPS